MKKILISGLVLVLAAFFLVAATKQPTAYSSRVNTYSRSTNDWKIKSYSLAVGYVTSSKNDTVEIICSADEDLGLMGHDGAALTYYCAFDGNDEIAADSGDVVMKVLIGADSSAYYNPAFTPNDTSECVLNDSTYTFNHWTVQPDNSAGGIMLALPFTIPTGNIWSRLMIISSSSRMNAGDTCHLINRQLLIKRYTRP